MGVVYRAHDPAINRDVAVKLVHIVVDDAEQRGAVLARFRQEVQAAGRCSHPGIVAVFDFLEDDGDPAIVMELVEGSSLHRDLRDPVKRGGLSIPGILLPVLDALEHAHGLGVIHRDIKPANILITAAGKPKLADFGIARVAGSSATQAGLMLGTPSYMAPEQVDNARVDHRTDLFSVGAVLYEMISGKPPFAGTSITETILRLSGPAPADMAPVLAAGGQIYIETLKRALAKDPARRFQTAEAFASALRATADTPGPDEQATVIFSARSARAWDPGFLQQVERQLAPFTGPMARLTVMRAAADSANTEELYTSIARGLASAADRTMFLRAVGSGRVEPTLDRGRSADRTPAQTTSSRPPTLAAAKPIPAEAVAAAQAALVVHTGPIARVLVREAAAQAASGKDFIERLCAHVTKPDELAVLRRRLRSEVEPKLT